MVYDTLDKSQKFLKELFSLVKSSSKLLQKHAYKRIRTLRLCLRFAPVGAEQTSTGRFAPSNSTNFFEKKLDKKLFLLRTVQILNFFRWCSVVVHLKQPLNSIPQLQNASFAQKFFATFLSRKVVILFRTMNFLDVLLLT